MNPQTSWKIVQGTINDHLVRLESNSGSKALFKQPRDPSPFKLVEIANELIVNRLALELGIPVSQTYFENIEGKIGILTIIHSELNWGVIIAQGLQNKVQNIDIFKQLFAFDVFIANTDRNGRIDHVIVMPTENGYTFYAIDHGHTLNGCTHGDIKWKKEDVFEHNRFPLNNLNHLSESEIKSFNELEPIIKNIEGLQDGNIDNIVDSVCLLVSRNRLQDEQHALETNCEIIKALLKYRRDNIRSWLRDWCVSKEKPLVLLNN
ncbi:MAG: hypothetical protein ACRD90_00130 [Nitrosopumilaceae archaeon]